MSRIRAALVAIALWPLAARASTPEIAGMGGRSAAMAGTGAAHADGYDATYANPAGIVEPTRRRLTVGYVAGRFRLDLDGARRDVQPSNGVILGAAVPLPFGGKLERRLALGLGFYFPTNVLNRGLAPFPDEPRLALLETRSQVVTLLASLGARVTSRVSVGVGALVLAALVGDIRIGPDAGGRITTITEEQILASWAPVVGVRVRALDSLALGAVLRGVSQARYDITIRSSLGATVPLEIPVLRIAGVAQYDPLQAALEAAWRARPGLLVVGGATWKHWSAFPLVTENATAGAPPQRPSEFHDTVVPRVAVEAGGRVRTPHGALELVGRGGYLFEWSPAPRDEAGRALIDGDRHVVTLGAGLGWAHRYGVLQIDVFAQWHQLAASERARGSFVFAGGTVGVDL